MGSPPPPAPVPWGAPAPPQGTRSSPAPGQLAARAPAVPRPGSEAPNALRLAPMRPGTPHAGGLSPASQPRQALLVFAPCPARGVAQQRPVGHREVGWHRAERAERTSQQRALKHSVPPEPRGRAWGSRAGPGLPSWERVSQRPARGVLPPRPGTLAPVGEEGVTLGGAPGQPWRVVPAAPQGGGRSLVPRRRPLCPLPLDNTGPLLNWEGGGLPPRGSLSPGLSWPGAGSTPVSRLCSREPGEMALSARWPCCPCRPRVSPPRPSSSRDTASSRAKPAVHLCP